MYDLQFHYTLIESWTNLDVRVLTANHTGPLRSTVRENRTIFQDRYYKTLFISGSFVEVDHPFMVLEWNGDPVCGKRLMIPTFSMYIVFASRASSRKVRSSKSRFLWFRSKFQFIVHNLLNLPNQDEINF